MFGRRREGELLRDVVREEVNVIYSWFRELYRAVRGLEGRVGDVDACLRDLASKVSRGSAEDVAGLRRALERLQRDVAVMRGVLESTRKGVEALRRAQGEVEALLARLVEERDVVRGGEVDRAAVFLAQCALALRDEGLLAQAGLLAERGPVNWSYLWRKGVSAGDVVEALRLLGSGGRRIGVLEGKGLLKRVKGGCASTSLLRALLYHVVLVASQVR